MSLPFFTCPIEKGDNISAVIDQFNLGTESSMNGGHHWEHWGVQQRSLVGGGAKGVTGWWGCKRDHWWVGVQKGSLVGGGAKGVTGGWGAL